MNKNLFRIIFNRRRGQLMVVAETTCSQGKGAEEETTVSGEPTITNSATVTLGVIGFAGICALGAVLWVLPAPKAHAQVVAYRNAPGNQQPTIFQTANGVPQINIQTPSSAGVSRNIYSQFDVQSNGALLNNSKDNVKTQLGGWIQANPWLATGSARVILNEVNSSNPSYLNGYVEVAGQRAEVVIANPSGISVNGGGFINTSKATLTTGAPIVNSGNLDGYRVQGGNISINGNGLDLSTTDYSAILARAVQVNAGVWANELKVITGANQIDAASLAANTTPVTTTIAGSGAVPSFALDVAQIGGMYAGKIHLIGTEQGLGVRSSGTIGSTGGDFILQNNGWLTNTGALQASANLQITTQGNITNSGTLYASIDQTLNATGNVANSGKIQATNTLNLSASNISNTATSEISADTTQVNVISTLTNRGLIDGTDTQINANAINNIGTGRIYGDHLSIAASNLTNDTETVGSVTSGGAIAARDRLDLGISNTLTNREHALIYSVGDMAIEGALDANRYATGSATTLNNNSATIESGRNLSISSATINNTNDHFAYEIRVATIELDVREDINSGLYRIFTRITSLPYQTASDPAQILAGGDITLNSSSVTNYASHIVAGGALNIGSSTLANTDIMATKTIRDIGTTHTLVHIPQSGYCGTIEWNCVRAHDEWHTATYDSTATSTVAVVQETAARSSGENVANRTNSSLYKKNPSPTSAYLIETDTRFIDRKTWLGSDYMSNALSLDPTVTQKRLGDGFYEQKLIREQVAKLTGRRFLADYTSDEQEYKALMTSAITFGQKYNLRTGIALTAQQIAQLTSDIVWLVEQTVALPDGSSQKVLVPQLYVKVQPGDLDGSGALLAGKDVNLNLSGDLTNSGTIAGRKVIDLTADNVNNLGGRIGGTDVNVVARQDLNNIGSSIGAVNSLSVSAGRDLNIQTTTQTTNTQTGIANNSLTGVDRVAGLYVSGANGTLVASAGRDMNIVAGVVSNAGIGATSLSAGGNLNLSGVKTGEQNNIVWNGDNHLNYGTTQTMGSTINGGGNVNLNTGNDLTATAANVQATQALTAKAGGSVNILAGESATNLDEAHKTSSGGGLSGKSTLVTRNTSNTSKAVASNFGGGTVDIAANTKDINVKGSNVVSDNGTNLTADGNVNIEAATNTNQQSNYSKLTDTGFLSGGGIGVSYGTRMQSNDSKDTTTTAAASTLGSVGGNVNITSGNQYKQVGSDVLTPMGDISIKAKTVDIQEARETNKQSSEQKFEQSGLTLAVTSTVLSTLENAQSQIKATPQTSDSRMKALGAASAAANVKMTVDALKAGQGDGNGMVKTGSKNPDGSPEVAQGNAADKAGGIQVSLSYGQSSSQSSSSTASDTARGSTVKAGGTTTIQATGGGEASNLTIQGSDVSGKAVNLEADNKVNLVAVQNTTTQTSSSSNSSASVGIAAQLGNQGAGIGFTGRVSKGGGNGNGTETTYTNTHVAGADQVTIKSGNDTTLKGATVESKQVTANVGGNLNIESLQDAATYAEKNQQIGASGMIGAGMSGNLNYAKSNIDSNYASVTEQSGIKAGDGGFTVNVGGSTDLKGGAITSTQAAIDNNKNSFNTGGTLTTSDIQNKASFEAKSVSVSVSAGGSPMLGQGLSAALSGAGMGKDSGSKSSTTTAGISGIAGDTSKRTGDNAQGIGKIFDADKVRQEIQAQTKITQEFSKQASTAIASYSDQQKKDLQAQIRDEKTSKEDKAALKQQLDQVILEEKVLNILVGAVTGFGETMVTKESIKVAAEQMRAAVAEDSAKFKGVVDSTGKVVLSNQSGDSAGVDGDGKKFAGTRVDLDKLCGTDNSRCKTNSDNSLALTEKGQVEFIGAVKTDGTFQTYAEFLQTEDGKKMTNAPFGGQQGSERTWLFGEYPKGGIVDKLLETFAGPHDTIGGKWTGLYDDQGNTKRGMSSTEDKAYQAVSGVALVPAGYFAAAKGLPPEVWKAIEILLKAGQ